MRCVFLLEHMGRLVETSLAAVQIFMNAFGNNFDEDVVAVEQEEEEEAEENEEARENEEVEENEEAEENDVIEIEERQLRRRAAYGIDEINILEDRLRPRGRLVN